MIKGTPAVVEEIELLLRLRRRASENPNWAHLANGIRTHRTPDGRIKAGYDPLHPGAQRAYELEFGTADERPQSVFRTVIADHPHADMTKWWDNG